MTKVTFSNRLLVAMQSRGVNQTQLAERTKISKSMISEYLQGKYLPKQDKVYKIARSLEVDESWLMGYDVDMTPNRYLNDDTENGLNSNYTVSKALLTIHERTEEFLKLYLNLMQLAESLNDRGLTKTISYMEDISKSDENIRDYY